VRQTVLALICVCALAASAAAQEAIFVVRHAERADSSADAPLSAEGEARAAKLSEWLRTSGITHIYTTDLRRTIQTALPFAAANHLSPQQVPAADSNAVVRRVLALAATDRALVVGHSNTIPALLRQFGVTDPVTIGDTEYDNIFVVVRREHTSAVLLRFKY
jgi:broad specificity phosphatase PhoE